MSNPQRSESGELDVWWGAYDPRTMLPQGVIVACVSGSLLYQMWNVNLLRLTEALVLLFWLLQLALWLGRVFGLEYRLTTKHLMLRRGFGHPEILPIELSQVEQVRVTQHIWEKMVGVGSIEICLAGCAKPAMVWRGIHNPLQIVSEIRRQVSRAQQRSESPTS